MSFRKILHLFHSFEHEWNKMSSIRLEWKITRLPVTYTSIAFIFKKFSEEYFSFTYDTTFSCAHSLFSVILQPILPIYLFDIPLLIDEIKWRQNVYTRISMHVNIKREKIWINIASDLISIYSTFTADSIRSLSIRGKGPFASISWEISSRVVKPSLFLRRGEHTLKCFFDTGHEDKKRA